MIFEALFMSNDSPCYYPTETEILCVQNHGPGWEDIWNRIATELLQGCGGHGRLRLSVRLHLIDKELDENEVDAVVAYIMCENYIHANGKRIFCHYDHVKSSGNVYNFLCNRTRIRQQYSRYRINEYGRLPSNVTRIYESHSEEGEGNFILDTIPSPYRDMPAEIQGKLVLLCSRLCDEMLTLRLSESDNLDRNSKYAGIQLYPRLNKQTMQWLINLVDEAVRNEYEHVPNAKPSELIEDEHRQAQERIRIQTEEYHNELLKDIFPRQRMDVQRKLLKLDLERYFWPLNAVQMIRLLHMKRFLDLERNYPDKNHEDYKREYKTLRNLVDINHKRYRDSMWKILPVSEEYSELLNECEILNKKGEGND